MDQVCASQRGTAGGWTDQALSSQGSQVLGCQRGGRAVLDESLDRTCRHPLEGVATSAGDPRRSPCSTWMAGRSPSPAASSALAKFAATTDAALGIGSFGRTTPDGKSESRSPGGSWLRDSSLRPAGPGREARRQGLQLPWEQAPPDPPGRTAPGGQEPGTGRRRRRLLQCLRASDAQGRPGKIGWPADRSRQLRGDHHHPQQRLSDQRSRAATTSESVARA